MTATEQRIRELAYQIWQSEGCPHGEEGRHWEMACKLAHAEENGASIKPTGRTRKTTTKPTDATPSESKATRTRSAAAKTGPSETGSETVQTIRKPRTPRTVRKEDK